MTTTKQRIKEEAARRRRSAFRDEFYKDARKKPPARAAKRTSAASRVARRMPLWMTAGGLAVLFCVIAVGGSSAMIWLRKLGALFGVYWVGD